MRADAARQHKRGRMGAQLAAVRAAARGRPVHLGGTRPWDPGGRSLREQIFESKRPVEANKKDAAGTNAHNETRTWPPEESVRQYHGEKPHTWYPSTIVPSCHRGVHQFSVLRPIEMARRRPGRCRDVAQGIAHKASDRKR